MRQRTQRSSRPSHAPAMDDPIPTDIGRAVTQRCPRAAQQRLGHDAEVPALVAAYAEREAARAAAALDRLLALCAPAAAEIARSYVAQEADVADIAQDALLALSRHLRQLREPAAFAHWFATLAHNAARQWLRRERARRAERSLDVPARSAWLGDELPESPLDVPDPAAAAAFLALEARDQLHRLLGTLPTTSAPRWRWRTSRAGRTSRSRGSWALPLARRRGSSTVASGGRRRWRRSVRTVRRSWLRGARCAAPAGSWPCSSRDSVRRCRFGGGCAAQAATRPASG